MRSKNGEYAFANTIHTPDRGTHLTGVRTAFLDYLHIADTAAVPFAAQTLLSRLQMLTEQVVTLADDPEFQTALRGAFVNEGDEGLNFEILGINITANDLAELAKQVLQTVSSGK